MSKNNGKITVWLAFKTYINAKSIKTVITRQELLIYVSCWVPRYSHATVDYCRNMAEKAGFLSKASITGGYIIEEHLPEDMNISKLRNMYNEKLYQEPVCSEAPKKVCAYCETCGNKKS